MLPSDADMSGHARTYPQLVAGNLTKFEYNDDSHDFSMKYNIDVEIDAPTVIYYSKNLHYANGVDVTVEGDDVECVEQGDNFIECKGGEGAVDGAEVSVKLSAKG